MQKRINTAFNNQNVTLAAQFVIGKSMGSGIYVAHKSDIYFCTARHVVFNETTKENKRTFSLKNSKARIKSYPKKSNFKIQDEIELDLSIVIKSQNISFNAHVDLCVIKIGSIAESSFKFVSGIKAISKKIDLNVASSSMIKSASNIEVGEETYVIGYPKALAKFQPQSPMYNYELPLVRKGIISCMNDYKSFVIDCAVYGGNSGGPVFVAENLFTQVNNGFQIDTKTYLVGIVTKYIPLVNTSASLKSNSDGRKISIPSLENSGYGICITFELIQQEIDKLIEIQLKET